MQHDNLVTDLPHVNDLINTHFGNVTLWGLLLLHAIKQDIKAVVCSVWRN